jgi:hypothetical protein
MRSLLKTLVLVAGVANAVGACEAVPVDNERSDNRLFAARGVIRGTVSYSGPHPCSRDGHIVGDAVLLVFDAKNPPPPAGLASTAVNFVTVSGDRLFANEPRHPGKELYCPKEQGVVENTFASAPFELAPLDGGAYLLQSFFDATGHFLPTFKFRNLPEAGDIGGGYVDAIDAAKHLGDPSYAPVFKVIEVGVPVPSSPASAAVPRYAIPPTGFVADNIAVTLGAPIALPRPYFYPAGAEVPDEASAPVLVMTQDHHVLANPFAPSSVSVATFQASFKAIRLNAGVPAAELAAATDPTKAFRLQIAPPPTGGLFVWTGSASIPETASQPPHVPMLWPLAVFAKLADAPNPQGLTPQGSAELPVVVIQGITLNDDDIFTTALAPPPRGPTPDTAKDHVTVLVRPSVLCFDPRKIDLGGLLVTPHLTGQSADPNEKPLEKPLFIEQDILAANKLIRAVKRGCLPLGKYGINLVYPTGQAWTTPNEIGSCAPTEGVSDSNADPAACSSKPRPVLQSQGHRAVIQIVEPTTEEGQSLCARDFPVPAECLRNPQP